jgi:hypothetical protein
MSSAVSGLQLVVPDNTTTLANYVQTYPPSSLSSNHWVGSNQIGSVVDANLKVIGTNNLVRVMNAPCAGEADALIVCRGRFDHACVACGQSSRCSHVRNGARRCENPRAFRRALMSFLGVSFILHSLHSNASVYASSSNHISLSSHGAGPMVTKRLAGRYFRSKYWVVPVFRVYVNCEAWRIIMRTVEPSSSENSIPEN